MACSTNHITASCSGGQCNGTCEAGYSNCASDKRTSGCQYDLNNDKANCGGCGTDCESLASVATATCTGMACSISTCDSGAANCNGTVGDGCELNTTNNADNCNGCGIVCSSNHMSTRTCSGSACNGSCAAGYADCINGKQVDGCETNIDSGSITHCGGCNMACSTNNITAACSGGQCTGTCAAGFDNCGADKRANGCAINKTNDKNNCGACGNICENKANVATATCASSACVVSTCDGDYKDCNTTGSDGCEIDSATNADNCGACGTVCSSNHMASRTCGAKLCNGTCATDYLDCNGNKQSDGCEINKTNDANNCGSCGNVCATVLAGVATATCEASTCKVTTCDAGLGNCDTNDANGCETNITAGSTAHCGGCGMACSANNVTPACSSSNCQAGTCAANFADCDSNKRSNGCETNLTNTTASCGACGFDCATKVANVAGPITCAASACTYTGACAPGFADCDGNKANGCEVNLNSDTMHCGSCPNVCNAPTGGTPTCTAGVCDFTCAQKRCGDVCAACCDDTDCPLDPDDKCQDPKCTNPGAVNASCGFALKGCVQQECHNTPTCNPGSGECQSSPLTGGVCGATGCCATAGTCADGVCACETPKDCSSGISDCKIGLCAIDGNCTTQDKANTTPCTAADKCMLNTQCAGGECVGEPKVCSPSGECRVASCDSSTGDCNETNATAGTACNSQNECVQNEVCNAVGECTGTVLGDDTPCTLPDCAATATCQSGTCTCPGGPTDGGIDMTATAADLSTGGTTTLPDLTAPKGADKSGCSAAPLDPSALSLWLAVAALAHRRRRR